MVPSSHANSDLNPHRDCHCRGYGHTHCDRHVNPNHDGYAGPQKEKGP